MVSISRLSAQSCHLLGKIIAMGTFFSMRQLCLQSKETTGCLCLRLSYLDGDAKVLTWLEQRDGLEAGELGVVQPQRRNFCDNVSELTNFGQK